MNNIEILGSYEPPLKYTFKQKIGILIFTFIYWGIVILWIF